MIGKMTKSKLENIEESQGLIEGAHDDVELKPMINKSEVKFNLIVDSIKAGKKWVLRAGYTQNSVYVLLKKLREKANINATYGVTVNDGVEQYVIYLKA